MKFKRLLAVALACCICCSVLVLPVSAEQHRSNLSHFITDISREWDLYKNGEISLSDFYSRFMTHATTEFAPNVVADIFGVKDVLHFLEKQGVDVSDYWETYYNDAGGGGGSVDRDDSILEGYSAACAVRRINRSTGQLMQLTIFFGDYGIIYDQWASVYGSTCQKKFTDCIHNKDAVITSSPDKMQCTGCFENEENVYADTSFYGDWRYADGSSADDNISELPEPTIPGYDDDSLTDDDLIDFFDDLLDKLKLDFPDLSTIEGLLAAILAKLGTLDSDNDNELLMQILAAIQALKNNGETADNSELLNTLEELKNALVFKDGDKVSSLAELLNTLVQNQVRRSDITIDPKLYNQRYTLIEAKLLGKFSFISEIKNFVQYAIDSYSNTENSPTITIDLFNYQHTIDFSAFDGSINLIRWIVAAFVYLSYAFATFRKIPGYINGGDNQ